VKILGLVILLAVLVSGCAYTVQPAATAAVNIHSSYDTKVPGKFAVVIDDSVRNVSREVRPTSHACGAHTYPVKLGDAVSVSFQRTLDSVLEGTIEKSSMPSAETMTRLGLRGVVLVRMDNFSPRLSCSTGFWSITCTGSTELSFGISVRGPAGPLFGTSVSGSNTFDGGAGSACEGAAVVLAESITRATRDALERMAERMSNSSRLRSTDAR
jgi:hypothetical protein